MKEFSKLFVETDFPFEGDSVELTVVQDNEPVEKIPVISSLKGQCNTWPLWFLEAIIEFQQKLQANRNGFEGIFYDYKTRNPDDQYGRSVTITKHGISGIIPKQFLGTKELKTVLFFCRRVRVEYEQKLIRIIMDHLNMERGEAFGFLQKFRVKHGHYSERAIKKAVLEQTVVKSGGGWNLD